MGQQASRKSTASCNCGCGTERKRLVESGNVHRYVAAITDRWNVSECGCRRRRSRRPACVCTAYRRVSDDRLAAVLTLGARDLRRELDAIVHMNSGADNEAAREAADPVNAELYVLSVTPRNVDVDFLQENRTQDIHNDNGVRLHQHFQVVCGPELRALLARAPPLPSPLPERVHTQVDYIHCLVPDLQQITACSYYWGKMDRYEAESLLEKKPEGTFLLRDSAQEEHLFSVSFRKYGRSLHARIEHHHRRFSFDSHDPAVYSARTVSALLHHYKDPACVMFFEPMLTVPLPRTQPFTLQQLTRAVIVSNITYDGVDKLPLPSRIRSYLKQYHYRQRVRVRHLDT